VSRDADLERYVLWRLTERPEERVLAALEPEDFTDRARSKWYAALAGESIQSVDDLYVSGVVEPARLAEEVGGSDFWHVSHREALSAMLRRCAHLRRLRYRRELASVSQRLARAAEDGEDDLTAFQEEDDYLARLRDRIEPPERVDPIEQLRAGLQRQRVPFGLPSIDGRTGGTPRGGVSFVLSRPGIGKSTLAANIGLHVRRHLPHEDVVIVSLEQPADEFVGKMMQADLGLLRDEVPRLLAGERINSVFGRTLDDFRAITERLHVWDDTRTMEAIARRCAMLDGPVALVVVDYVQRVRSEQRYRSRYELVTASVEECRPLAIQLRAALVVCSQCSREAQRTEAPSMSAARDTGAIEEEADICLGLYRPEWVREQGNERRMADLRLKILKQKWGYGGVVSLDFDLHYQRITEPETQGRIPV
jgi:replicative DNA helicase